jgi:hypothetical protein
MANRETNEATDEANGDEGCDQGQARALRWRCGELARACRGAFDSDRLVAVVVLLRCLAHENAAA